MERLQYAVKEHVFDANVIVKILDITQPRSGTTHVCMDGRSGVSGKRQPIRVTNARRTQKSGDASATGRICLQHIDSFGAQHAAKIRRVVAVFTCCNIHPRGTPIPHESQARQIIRRNWLFKPGHAVFRKLLRLRQCLLSAIGPVGIYEEFRLGPDCLARRPHPLDIRSGIPADFHLHAGNPLLYPT